MSALPEQYLSLEEYFHLEETSEVKHEYYRGEIFAMTGGTERHNLIAGDTFGSLLNQLRGKPCRPYPSDFRLKISAMKKYSYPDISVICGATELADGRQDTFLNPTVLIEVLSASTEAYDRGPKTECYRTIPSLRAYLLIVQDRLHVERYQRRDHDWLFTEFSSLEDTVALDAIGCALPLAAIYQRLAFADGIGTE